MPDNFKSYIPSYICNKCDVLYTDGPQYTWCPKCNRQVDIIDPTKEIYVCRKCEYMRNENFPREQRSKIFCRKCDGVRLTRVMRSGLNYHTPSFSKEGLLNLSHAAENFVLYVFPVMAIIIMMFISIGFLEVFKFRIPTDPISIMTIASLGLPLVIYGGTFLYIAVIEIYASLGFFSLFWDKKSHLIKINHGLEHATFNVLQENNLPIFSGLSDENGFRLEGPVNAINIGLAFIEAVKRIKAGERKLALTIHCGTRVGIIGLILLCIPVLLITLLIKGYLTIEIMFLFLVVLFTGLFLVKKEMSLFAQKFFTTSVVFNNVKIIEIEIIKPEREEFLKAHYVKTLIT